MTELKGRLGSRLAGLAPLLAAWLALAAYGVTLVREPVWGDGAEFGLQIYQLGVTHPPGYPVYILLGKLTNLLVPEPALAANLLSAVAGALAVGLLAQIAWQLTGEAWAGLLAALILAFSPHIWDSAVSAEVHNVNLCLLGLALLLMVTWERRPASRRLVLAAAMFGLSLGTYLANALLAPAFAWLIWQKRERWLGRLLLFGVVVAVVGGLVLSWTYFRAGAVLPLGVQTLPTSPRGFLAYLTGSQYGTTRLQPLPFYLRRIVEHGRTFGHAFWWLGVPLGLVGLACQWREQRPIAAALLIAFVLDLGYFTGYVADDYATMVNPAYFIFALWIAWGLHALARWPRRRPGLLLAGALGGLVAVGLFASQFGPRLERSRQTPVTTFVQSAFALFPPRAVVLAEWVKYTPLLYFQRVHGLRPDVTLVERSELPRCYAFGTVADWRDYARRSAAQGPVLVDNAHILAPPGCGLAPAGERWYRLLCP